MEEKTPSKSKEVEQRRESKCYNCNKEGHIAKNCDKAKRERGSYECGSTDHLMRDCKKKKQTTAVVAATNSKESQGEISNVIVPHECENEYRRQAEVQMSADKLECRFIADSQLDTACPVSLIKARFVPPSLIMREKSERYEGINESALEIQGVIRAKICVENAIAEDVTLRIVPERTMKCDALLGRDVLKKLGLTKIKQSRECEVKSIANEILSIDVSEVVSSEVDRLDINPDLPYAVKCRVIEKFQMKYLQAEKPKEPKIKAELKLNIKDKQPFHHAPSKLTIGEKSKLRAILDDLLERGIIRPSISEYASRTVLEKKDESTWLRIDFRTLNKVTARENHPLPIIEEHVEALEGKHYFTSLDLKEGFHQVGVHEDSIKYTVFIMPFGQFEYVKMPFGLKNASARFQRYINDVFEPLIRDGLILVYIDDFLIATETVEEHMEALDRVFEVLVENKLELRQNKCKFMYEKIDFLGYVISNSGIVKRCRNSGSKKLSNAYMYSRCAKFLKFVIIL